jgi:hypothetical protein
MAISTITTVHHDDILDDTLTGSMGTVTISGAGASGSTILSGPGTTYSWTGTGSGSMWNNTNYTINSGVTTSIGATGSWNGTYATYNSGVNVKSKISIDVENERAVISTEKNKIDIDELAEMITLMKSLLVAVASDEEFARRNPALADAAHDMLINKLKG